MSRPAAVAVVVLVILLAWALMYVGWRGRARRQGHLPAPAQPTPELAERAARDGIEATYVSTTTATDWLDRVAAHGLGVTGEARVLVVADGVVLVRTGASDVLLPVGDLRDVRRESARAGKAVPGDGLVVVDWSLGDTVVSTAVRPRHAADREALVAQVRALVATPDDRGESR